MSRPRPRPRPQTEEERIDAIIDEASATGDPIDMASAFPDEPERDDAPGGVVRGDDSPIPPNRMIPDPGARLQEVANSQAGYMQEYQLRLLHRMLLRNLPLDMIAQHMGTSVNEVTRLRRELFRRLKHEAGNMDMLTHAGRTLSFYDEARATALKMASDGSKSFAGRVKALGTALQAEADKHQFLRYSGFYDTVKFHPKSGADDPDAADASTLGDIARFILDPSADIAALSELEIEDAGRTTDEEEYLANVEDAVSLL